MIIPRRAGQFRGVLWDELRTYLAHARGTPNRPAASAVVPTTIGDRIVFRHTWISRVAQRTMASAVGPQYERIAPDCVHGYRPGKSRWTALTHARGLVRHGWRYAAYVDIRDFFGSIDHLGAAHALEAEFPRADDALLDALCATWQLEVWGDDPREKGRGLFQGSVLAPLIANVFALHFIDRSLLLHAPDVRFVRYADDIVILAKTEQELERGVDRALTLVDGAGLAVHPVTQADVFHTPVDFLGKQLHGKQVVTPVELSAEHATRIDEADEKKAQLVISGVVNEYQLDRDPADRIRRVMRRVEDERRRYALLQAALSHGWDPLEVSPRATRYAPLSTVPSPGRSPEPLPLMCSTTTSTL